MMELLIATRPWSFPASVVAVLIASALSYNELGWKYFSFVDFLLTVFGAILIQCVGNLVNTYFDWKSGLDQKATADDRTMFDLKTITPHLIKKTIWITFISATLIGAYLTLTMPTYYESLQLFFRFLVGALLAVGYTGGPIQLKYLALGDLAIFICFGPLIVESTFYIHMHHRAHVFPMRLQPVALALQLVLFSLPQGFLTEAILHANNTRDIAADRKAGAKTVAQLLGHRNSFFVYFALFAAAYIGAAWLAYAYISQG